MSFYVLLKVYVCRRVDALNPIGQGEPACISPCKHLVISLLARPFLVVANMARGAVEFNTTPLEHITRLALFHCRFCNRQEELRGYIAPAKR